MDTMQSVAPGGEHEDPFTDAGQKGSSYISLALAMTQRRVDSQIKRLGLQPRTDRQRGTARPKWATMLAPDEGRSRSTTEALDAWIAAVPHRDADRGARVAAHRAERRLAELHPDAMARYHDLRRSLDPMDAMWVAASQFHTAPTAAAAEAITNTLTPSSAPTYEDTIRGVLEGQLAERVLADPGWSRLADALAQTADQGRDAAEELVRVAAGQRELESARFPATVLRHRITELGVQAAAAPVTGLYASEASSSQAGSPSYPAALSSVPSAAIRVANDHGPSGIEPIPVPSRRSRHS